MNTIFRRWVYQQEKGQDAVLATIIWDDGSAPRGAGNQAGGPQRSAGRYHRRRRRGGRSIAIAREMLADGTDSMTREFRLRRDGSEQSTGMVCGGDVTVYFRRIPCGDRAWDTLAAEVLRRVSTRTVGWLVQPLDGTMPLSDG